MKVIVSVCTKVDGKVKVIVSSGFYTKENWKVEAIVSKWILHQNSCWRWNLFHQNYSRVLEGVKRWEMQDGNSVETLHWVKLVNHYIWEDNTSLLCSYFHFLRLWFFWVFLTVHFDCWSHKVSEQFIPHDFMWIMKN